jgi:hypothetical protein
MTVITRKILRAYASCCVLLLLVGCGIEGMAVVRAPANKMAVSSVEVEERGSTLSLPNMEWDRVTGFREKLRRFLYEDGAFREGPELKIRYRLFHQGDLASVLFPRSRSGSDIIEATYLDASNKELATIQVEAGKTDASGFGKDFSGGLERAAKEIADYTKQNFR